MKRNINHDSFVAEITMSTPNHQLPQQREGITITRIHIYSIVAVLILCIGISTIALFQPFTQKRIAFVRSGEIIYKYTGMKDAQQAFEEKVKIWQSNIDTLHSDFRYAVDEFSMTSSSLPVAEQHRRQEHIRKQEEELLQYRQAIEVKSQEEEKTMTQGVLNQINSFITEYGKEHSYDVILGTTMSGSVLYGDDALDITEDVLRELNRTYIKR